MIVRVATGLPLRRPKPAASRATGVPNRARTSEFLFFNRFTAHFVNVFLRCLCNRLIVATIPLDFALLSLIIVSLWVRFSELAELVIAQAVCQTLVVRKRLEYSIASLPCQDGKKMRLVESVENFDQKVGLHDSFSANTQGLNACGHIWVFFELRTTTERDNHRPKRARAQKDRSASASL